MEKIIVISGAIFVIVSFFAAIAYTAVKVSENKYKESIKKYGLPEIEDITTLTQVYHANVSADTLYKKHKNKPDFVSMYSRYIMELQKTRVTLKNKR